MKKNVFFVAAIFAALCLNSCDKNDPDNPIAGGSGKILLTTALPNATGMDGTVYMQLIDEPVLGKTMATNNNNGINVPFGRHLQRRSDFRRLPRHYSEQPRPVLPCIPFHSESPCLF